MEKAIKERHETQQKEMERQLSITKTGDLVEFNDNQIFYVDVINKDLTLLRKVRTEGKKDSISDKVIKRIIHKTDLDYPAMAVKFINQ